MMNFVTRLLARPEPMIAEARQRDCRAIAGVHSASFQRGWSEDEFVLSRLTAGEAEILSVAIAPNWRGRGFARPLLARHLGRLAGLGARTVFLEVGEDNAPACRLYRRAGFYDVGRRQAYYGGDEAALVLRRDLG